MWPNPMTAPLQFRFELARATSVRVDVYDLAGRRVATVASGELTAGVHGLPWDGRTAAEARLGPGVYVAVLHAGEARDAQRFVLTR